MGNLKNLLKQSTNVGATALLLLGTLLPTLTIKDHSIVNAASTTTNLTPGETLDTGNHTWGLSDFQTANNYTPVGKNTKSSGWINSSTYNFGTNQPNTGSWLPFNGAIDMSQPLTINGATFAKGGGLFPNLQLGDANGILLTDLSSSQLSGGATGGNLGVGNLGSGTYFIGNNYSFKNVTLGVLSNYNTASVIAQGDGAGAKILSNSSDYEANSNSTNAFSMSWTNPVINSDGTVTGTISYTSRNAGTDYTTSAIITVQQSMSIGFMAATGGNYSEMSVTINSVTGGKGTQPVIVNYLNGLTGEQISPKRKVWNNSTINANVGDKIGVIAPNSSDEAVDTYNYVAPTAPEGYSFDTASPSLIVQNFPSNMKNPNQINVSYVPQPQNAKFSYSYDPLAPLTPTAPPEVELSGVTDQELISATPNLQQNLENQVPGGYYISKITSALGESTVGASTIETLSSFFAEKPSFDAISRNNQYQIMLSALNQTGVVSFDYDTSVTGEIPTLPTNFTLSGLTGSNLSFVIPDLPSGYEVTSVIAPDNITYPSITEALAANNHFIDGQNSFKIIVSAMKQSGLVSYRWASDVPGQNGVAGKLQANLPKSSTLTGVTGSTINFTPTIPEGYGIKEVTAPDGKIYTDTTIKGMTALEAAESKNYKFAEGSNDFIISLQALPQEIILNLNLNESSNSFIISKVLTGAPIDSTSIENAQTWLYDWITENASGWTIKDFVDPRGIDYVNSNLASVVSKVGGIALAHNNIYQANLIYEGKIGFSSVPSKINFGTNLIVSKDRTYNGILDNPVVVLDTRAENFLTPWSVSVTQVSALQEMLQTDTPLVGGISFMDQLSYDSKVLTSSPQVIYSIDHGEEGETTIINANSESMFTLNVPSSSQKANTNFKGTLEWTLTSAP
ncbi:WxL domain-containing protein [Lactococcus lactis]|uniref:WxL domain-containing protein n=1 Tax=Lactococcus lactis TaxID=1358 RepID=A0A9X4NIR7_9LACT|nr:WxL domain-containing protein [Lactococcus lactis]MDG4984174.1 WxL domain-containing protein [Lactococcus lactis]